MTDAKPFPPKAWDAAASGREVERALGAQMVWAREVVLSGQTGGRVAAVAGACLHRCPVGSNPPGSK
jgi:hypothetical protein